MRSLNQYRTCRLIESRESMSASLLRAIVKENAALQKSFMSTFAAKADQDKGKETAKGSLGQVLSSGDKIAKSLPESFGVGFVQL